MVKKRINHSKAAVREAGKAGVDLASIVIEDLGRLRHGVSAVKHGEKAVQHANKALKSAVQSKVDKVKKDLGLKPKKKRKK